jgi:phosphoglycerate dehydrogenase-like enzyme
MNRVLVTWIDYDLDDPNVGGALRAAGLEIVVAPRLGHRSPAELSVLLGDAVAAIVSVDPFDRDVLGAAPKLRVISRVGVGTDSIDVPRATELGIAVAVTPGANAETVADHTLALVLTVLRRVVEQDRLVRRGVWQRVGPMMAAQLHGATVGVVGFGAIGRAVVRRLEGFGADVLIHDPFVAATDGRFVGFEELLRGSDVVSLHLPHEPGRPPLIDGWALAQMRPGAVLVNTARGRLVDEHAVVEALTSGRLRAAALDVFADEPLTSGNALQALDNVVLTPHTAGISATSNAMMTRTATRNVLDVLAGRLPDTVINPEAVGGRDVTNSP